MVLTENICKKYGNYTALNNVSITVPKGSIFGLLGPNGAGKTSFIRILNQITYPDSGRIFFNGEPLNQQHISQIGYLPEERGLYKTMKVGEQAIYLAQLKGLSKEKAKERLKFWFERLDIGSWWNKKIQELSKGMAQKIQFVVTVLHEPKLLIFDEPFSGFDPINANVIKDEILYLREQGATIIFSTHRMESVEELCDHIALINKSEKILEGNLLDIKRSFKSNIFEVGLKVNEDKQTELLTELQEHFSVDKANFKSLYDSLKLNIYKKEYQTANELLQYLNSRAEVTHFVEKIPTVDEIFMRSVEKKN
ncbi:ABC transporter ATP-binding protein [Capnocytophaga cynodegmi]|uniref:ABC transporter, ATP-binding protein n=1 Tax=Capnocytophaga cynodegmi TaxID=28189 RepID=A0A0B7H7W9_9FLAO|nr:ATP-binding cassette domain-containing protein [Capnocytophaga cynodegmi]CEN35475.1 ABC transporter, ATP-binding protein [Capnocytophaga cynodegmi]CEN39497.1 ABC transporter, ATP-binding protein [Capnocytophaga cynodegmi]